MSNTKSPLLIFTLDNKRYAISSFSVKRIIRVVEIAVVPNPEKNILGIINVQGKIVPVIDIRTVLGLSKQEKERIEDLMVIVQDLVQQNFCFVVDNVDFVEADSALIISAEELASKTYHLFDKVFKDPDRGPIHILNMANIVGQINRPMEIIP